MSFNYSFTQNQNVTVMISDPRFKTFQESFKYDAASTRTAPLIPILKLSLTFKNAMGYQVIDGATEISYNNMSIARGLTDYMGQTHFYIPQVYVMPGMINVYGVSLKDQNSTFKTNITVGSYVNYF